MSRNAKEVPKVAWEYYSLVSFMFENPGLYTTDEMRRDCHERLCKHYGISKESSRSVTDNLDKYEDAVEMHESLLEIYRTSREP